MAPRCPAGHVLLMPFLYPCLARSAPRPSRIARACLTTVHSGSGSEDSPDEITAPSESSDALPRSRLNPSPDDYAVAPFADKAIITISAGHGGHGCISFLRELFIEEGPANGGDGGHGGNVYIQAVHAETSLHKLTRRGMLRAGRGKTGQGKGCSGQRGEDLVIHVPVGTVVRELDRKDPAIEELLVFREAREKQREFRRKYRDAFRAAEARGEDPSYVDVGEAPEDPNAHKFVLYPGISTWQRSNLTLPQIPQRDRLVHQPPPPILLDLSVPSPNPILLAAGGIGGLGNPHFVSKDIQKPLFATRGERPVSMRLELELKLLADVGLVGLPNAGKSTLLRAITHSRARVGNWAFTTLQPNIGTVVLDNGKGKPLYPQPKPKKPEPHTVIHDARYGNIVISQPDLIGPEPEPRTHFTVADIPGLIEGAHLDKGLGIEFLRHVERAGVLAFVVDLSKGDAVQALKSLWREVGLYARMCEEETKEHENRSRLGWNSQSNDQPHASAGQMLHMFDAPHEPPRDEGGLHIAAKPWFVVATKADLPGTQGNYGQLKGYLDRVTHGQEPHPSGVEHAWTLDCAAIPVSAINGHGVDRIVQWIVTLLDE